jgi:hypothetical protein
MLKEYVNEHFPYLEEMGNSQDNYNVLCDAIE